MKSIHFRSSVPTGRSTAVALALLALCIPTAAAADLGPIGEPDLASPAGVIGILLVVAGGLGIAGFAAARKMPALIRRSPWLAVAAGAGLVAWAPGGVLASDAEPASASAAVADALVASSGQKFSTVDVTFITREKFDNDAVVSAEIRIYDASKGYTDRQMLEESVNPLYTGTTDGTSAEKEFTSLPALNADGSVAKYHIVVDKSGFYNPVFHDMTFLVDKPALSTAQSGVPPIQTLALLPIGDFDTSEDATTYSANSAQFTYALDMKNSDSDGYIVGVAAKLTASTMTNIAFDNVAANQPCEAVDVSGTTYIKWTGDNGHGVGVLGPSEFATCNILLTTTSTTSDFGIVLDDLFTYEGATNFNGHANIRDMTAESEVNPADAS